MNYMYTVYSKHGIGAIRRFILKLFGVRFFHSFKRAEVKRNED